MPDNQEDPPTPESAAQSAGYSGVPLAKKLGIRAGQTVRLGDVPPNWWQLVELEPGDLNVVDDSFYAFGHWFVRWRAQLDAGAKDWALELVPSGMLWVSWPKKAAKVAGDINEDDVRAAFLPLGLVDVKVCAVDETWSGLKLVRRRSARGAAAE